MLLQRHALTWKKKSLTNGTSKRTRPVRSMRRSRCRRWSGGVLGRESRAATGARFLRRRTVTPTENRQDDDADPPFFILSPKSARAADEKEQVFSEAGVAREGRTTRRKQHHRDDEVLPESANRERVKTTLRALSNVSEFWQEFVKSEDARMRWI